MIKNFIFENVNFFEPIIEWVQKITTSGEVFTHSGKFHADEVFSSAFLRIFGFEGKINRVSEVPDYAYTSNSLVYDIGGGQFDHHQENKECRCNGIPYAAFGLIAEASGIYKKFPEFEYFVEPLDNADNGGEKTDLSRTIAEMNPSFYNESSEASDEAFEEAVYLAETILLNKLRNLFDQIIASEMINNLIKDNNYVKTNDGDIVIISDCFIPLTYKSCYGKNIAGIICPSERDLGYYNLVCCRTHKISDLLYEYRRSIGGIKFIHDGLFIAVVDNYDLAVKIAESNVISWEDHADYGENVSLNMLSDTNIDEEGEEEEEDYSYLIRHPNRKVS